MSAQLATQTANYPAAFENPRFSFLAKPPPRKRRANAPFPPPPGSPPPVPQMQPVRKNSGILTWATHVQPGSPAPRSPHRRLSISSSSSRRSSISRLNRRPSISHNRAPSGSSLMQMIDSTPIRTPSTGKFDLTTLGYASVFIQFPKTPTTPSPYLREYHQKRGGDPAAPLSPKAAASGPLSAQVLASIPIPPIPQDGMAPKRKGMKRFRSLTILRPRGGKDKSAGPSSPHPVSPTKTSVSVSTRVAQAAKKHHLDLAAAAVSQRKHAKYPTPKSVVRAPPTLANELALMQFADGGSIEAHARRVMEAQARAAQGTAFGSAGVGAVHRDAQGCMWWDEDEEMEYAPLISQIGPEGSAMEVEWEAFAETEAGTPRTRVSMSTQASELDPSRRLPLPGFEDPRLEDRVLSSRRIGGAGMSVLALPSRPRRAVPHLTGAPTYLVDMAAFAPRSPPASAPTAFVASAASTRAQKQKVRRRPAPLTLTSSAITGRVRRSPVAPAARRVVAAAPHVPVRARTIPSPGGVARARREFIEESFAPAVAPASPLLPPASAAPRSILVGVDGLVDVRAERTTKRRGVRGLFGLGRKSD